MIRAESVYKRYKEKGRQVLNGVDLRFESGEFCAVTGESGSGKSTLLAVLAGILRPDRGRVILSGGRCGNAQCVTSGNGTQVEQSPSETDIYSLSDGELSRLRREKLGYVPQSNVFLKNYTVLENLTVPFLTKDNSEALKERACTLLESLGVGETTEKYSFELSGGEQKRVALARAFMTDPEIVIADEPTTGLDASTGGIILRFLKKETEEGKTVIVATHDEHVDAYVTRTVNMDGIPLSHRF